MPRRMREPAFRADQWAQRYEPHVEPLNRFVDELGMRDDAGHPPYIAPMYRGIEAPVLSLLRDPARGRAVTMVPAFSASRTTTRRPSACGTSSMSRG